LQAIAYTWILVQIIKHIAWYFNLLVLGLYLDFNYSTAANCTRKLSRILS